MLLNECTCSSLGSKEQAQFILPAGIKSIITSSCPAPPALPAAKALQLMSCQRGGSQHRHPAQGCLDSRDRVCGLQAVTAADGQDTNAEALVVQAPSAA